MPGSLSRVAVADTSPLVFLGQIGRVDLLGALFGEVWVPEAVEAELRAGVARGHSAVALGRLPKLRRVEGRAPLPSWLAFDLGPGELAAMAVAVSATGQHPVVLLDDALARRIAQAAGLTEWGTLRVLLEAKKQRHVKEVGPQLDALVASGMYASESLRRRVLTLAGEAG